MQLSAFVPQRRDFANDYQFEMHQSWFKKSGFKVNIPANFSDKSISKSFTNIENRKVSTEYLWEKWRIYAQREKLTAYCDFSANEVFEQLQFLEAFIYRLNCQNPQFVVDFFDQKKWLLFFQDMNQNEALSALTKNFQTKRFEVKNIQLNSRQSRLGFIVTNVDDISFEIYFHEAKDTASLLKEMRLLEELRTIELTKLREKETERLQELELLKEKVSVWQKEIEISEKEKEYPSIDKEKGLKIVDFIKKNYSKLQNRELLNNKIENSDTFIRKEFSGRTIQKNGNKYIISQAPFLTGFRNDMRIEVKNTKDGIDILPVSDYQVEGNKILLGIDETLNLPRLSEQEVKKIAPYLCQLLYGHRAIGTKLLNFLLIHDDVPTSLVLYGAERELFEMYSYANMILLLHHYWKDRTIYFFLDDFKKVNDFIEFTGFLAAKIPNSSTYDFAEIRYQLNHDFKIHLSMMILHPEISISENQ
jgi:hypothetical protein